MREWDGNDPSQTRPVAIPNMNSYPIYAQFFKNLKENATKNKRKDKMKEKMEIDLKLITDFYINFRLTSHFFLFYIKFK